MKRNITLLIALMATMLTSMAYAQNPKLSELTIVDKVDVTLTAPQARYENTAQRVTVDLTDALSKLGGGGLGMALHKFYIAQYDEQSEGKTDELTSTFNYRKGWWLTDIYDENIGEITGECVADTIYPAVMYIHDVELDDKQLSMTVGQVGNATIPGNTYFALLYYINGSNAIEIAVKMTITETSLPKLAEMTKVGERDINVSMYYNGSYKYRVIDLNADSLYDAIHTQIPLPDCVGYEEGLNWGQDMQLVLYAESEKDSLTDNTTANYGGYWLNKDGFMCNWGATGCALFCEPDNQLGLSALHVGIYPDLSLIDTSVKTTLYIVGDKFYYQLNIKLNITPQTTFAECETVDVLNFAIEMVPIHTGGTELLQADYMNNAIDLTNYVLNTFESNDVVFCTPVYIPGTGYNDMPSATNITGTVISDSVGYLNGYQMTDIRALAEDDNSFVHVAAPFNPSIPILTIAYGIGYKDGKLSFWQKDGVREVGDYYTAEFYLYSLDDQKKIKLNINVIYVNERNPVDIVKTTDITLPSWNTDKSDYASTKYDLSEVLDSLQCDDAGKIVWMAYNDLYQLIIPSNYDDLYGFTFTTNGRLLAEDANGAVFRVGYTDGEFHSIVMNPSDNSDYTTSIVAVYNGKGYLFNIKVSPTPDTGISEMRSEKLEVSDNIYNLAGQRISSPRKGINIINGKKVLFK